MSITDSTYLIGEIKIVNKSAVADDLAQAIEQYEKEILISLLGYKLYSLMIATPTVEPYKSLMEGAEFEMTFEGILQTVKWEGFKNELKQSLLAYYTYYKYEERNFIKPGAVGTNKPMAENAKIVSPYPKMMTAWNNMLSLYGWTPNRWFLYDKVLLKPTGTEVYNNAPSAFNYLNANILEFPDWIFTPLKPINPWA